MSGPVGISCQVAPDRTRASTLPINQAPALVAGREFSVAGFAPRAGLDFARNFQVAAAAFSAANRHARRQALRRNAVVKFQLAFRQRPPRRRHLGLRRLQLGRQARFPLMQRANPRLVTRDVRLQFGLRSGELLFRLVDLVHHLELLALPLADGCLGGLDLVSKCLKFIIFPHQRLLGAVFREFALGRANFGLDQLFARFQLPQLQPGVLDGGFLPRNLGLHGRNVPRDGL